MTLRSRLIPLNRRRVRFLLGLLWLLDAALQAQPQVFTSGFWKGDLAQSVMGQPAPVAHSILWAIGIVAAHAAVWNSLFVAVQALLGLALVSGRCERLAVVASLPWALGIWWVGEGFGALPTGFAMAATGAPGAVVLYPLIGFLAWPGDRGDARDGDLIAPRAGSAAWVVLWAGQAALQIPWAFPVGRVMRANVSEYSQAQPAWLASIARAVTGLADQHPVLLSATLAAVGLAVGCGVLSHRGRAAALVLGMVAAVAFDLCFQGLNGLVSGGATDPGPAPLLLILALALWPGTGSLPALEVAQLAVADQVHPWSGDEYPERVGGHRQVMVGHAGRPVGHHGPQFGRVHRRSEDDLGDTRSDPRQKLVQGGSGAAAAGHPDEEVGRHHLFLSRQGSEGEAQPGLVGPVG